MNGMIPLWNFNSKALILSTLSYIHQWKVSWIQAANVGERAGIFLQCSWTELRGDI